MMGKLSKIHGEATRQAMRWGLVPALLVLPAVAQAEDVTVQVYHSRVSPTQVSAAVSETVRFINSLAMPGGHSVASDDGSFPAQVRAEAEAGGVFDLAIRARKIYGGSNVVRVTQGEKLRLRWTSDEAATLHLHGYDIETAVRPGATASMTFTAYATGRFPVEAHGFADHRSGETTLLYLEVYPAK